jgi:putative nucleotidyltransferase with HDIG domain
VAQLPAGDDQEAALQAVRLRVLKLLEDPRYVPPSLPERALELERLCSRVDSPVSELTRLIREDSTLSAGVLRASNSVHAQRSGKAITSIERAILQIGYNGVRAVTFAIATRATFLRASSHQELLRDCFQHSLAVAHGTAWLAERTGLDHGAAYVAGLLHDVGKIVILHAVEKSGSASAGPVPATLVHKLLDSLHQDAGAYFARRWSLTDAVVDVCQAHHGPVHRQGLTSLVASINRLTRAIGLSLRPLEAREPAVAELAQQGISLAEVEALILSMQEHASGLME